MSAPKARPYNHMSPHRGRKDHTYTGVPVRKPKPAQRPSSRRVRSPRRARRRPPAAPRSHAPAPLSCCPAHRAMPYISTASPRSCILQPRLAPTTGYGYRPAGSAGACSAPLSAARMLRSGFKRQCVRGHALQLRASRRPRGVLAPQPRWSTRMTRQKRGSKNRLRCGTASRGRRPKQRDIARQ